ncbi:MAG TPA: hypothetical protein VGE98_11830 [Thermoanaerobaculia bacterium]
MRIPLRVVAVTAILLGLCAPQRAVLAQSSDEYTPPGGPSGRPVPQKQGLETAYENARFRFGPLRVDPRFSLQDVSYIDNVYGTETQTKSDFTATIGAGLRAYLRTGRKVIWNAHYLPKYVWWKDLTDRRRFNNRFGLGVAAYGNRFTLEAQAERDEEQHIVTAEVLQPASLRQDHGALNVDAQLATSLSAVVGVSLTEYTSLTDILPTAGIPIGTSLRLLDRRESVERAGLRYTPESDLAISLLGEHTDTRFGRGALNRSNSGISPVLEFKLDRKRTFVRADVAARSLDSDRGGQFVSFHQATGSADVGLGVGGRLELWFYGNRNLAYSLLPAYSYLTDERVGVAPRLKLGWRTYFRVYAETGDQHYFVFTPGTPKRTDDYTAYGAVLHMDFASAAAFELKGGHTSYTSNLKGFDRSFDSFTVGLVFSGDL